MIGRRHHRVFRSLAGALPSVGCSSRAALWPVALYMYVIATAFAVLAALVWALSGIFTRLYRIYVSPKPQIMAGGEATPVLRIALIGAASIAPHALLYPSRSIPEIAVVAVGARSADRARSFAKRWHIKLHGTYEQILSSEDVDAVYIALINGLHYEWAAAALRAGKHVLCEKPLTSNAREARELEQLARQRSLVLMEAYHNLHHPLATRMRELVRSGELGQLTSLSISSGLPGPDGFAPLLRDKLGLPPAQAPPAGKTSQRKAKMDVELGGGKFLGQGCYTVSMARWLVGDDAAGEDGGYDGGYDGGLYTSEHPSAFVTVESARMVEDVAGSRADVATVASLRLHSGGIKGAATSQGGGIVRAQLYHSSFGPGFDVTATFTRGSFTARNYLFPWVYHHLSVTRTQTDGSNVSHMEQHYGQRTTPAAGKLAASHEVEQSSSFALQLRAFATAVRLHTLRTSPQQASSIGVEEEGVDDARQRDISRLEADPSSSALKATSAASAVRNMEILDGIYDASGLGARPGRAQPLACNGAN